MRVKIFNSNWRKLSFFSKIIAYLTLFSNLLLILCYFNYLIPPSNFWMYSIIGLGYPFILIINVIFFVYWLFRKELFFLYTLIILLCGWYHHSRFIQLSPTSISYEQKNQLKVMSYNVRLFDLYNWTENKKTRNEIINQIKQINPDVVCFQEYYFTTAHSFQTRSLIVKELELEYYYENFSHESNENSKFGIATFSKYPIVQTNSISFSNDQSNQCIWTDLKVNKDTIRVYNAHLGSIRFNYSDYKLLGGKGNPIWPHQKKPDQQIINRLKIGFSKREQQLNQLLPSLKSSPHKTIICSDINDTPLSYAYHMLDKYFTDAFTQSANGIGGTYIGYIPGLRIDYIWHSKDLSSINFTTHNEKLSDHKAISASIFY
ncbi:MAG: endonuclease/exonuclease/phosphatase family protein [Bacteroidota bacterium]|nr:endonuclease/exonuclease/phosphatase family protein [Bacteroidota bacterium]